MSVVTFWSDGREQTGKTLSIAAISTYMAVEHNYRILIISTGYRDDTLNQCFWKEKKVKRNFGLFGPNTNEILEEGIVGLAKVVKSNKLSPENITNYTKIIFKDRLEVLSGYNGVETPTIDAFYVSLIKKASMVYDIVIVDLKKEINQLSQDILTASDVVVYGMTQKRHSIEGYATSRKEGYTSKMHNVVGYIGRYDKFSKYTQKNILRSIRTKDSLFPIVYNTLFSDACDEGLVVDYFLKMQTISEKDRNAKFLNNVKELIQGILYKIDEMQMMK